MELGGTAVAVMFHMESEQTELPDGVPPMIPLFCAAPVVKQGWSLGLVMSRSSCLTGLTARQAGLATSTL